MNDKNYNKVKKHLYKEARDLGYSKSQYKDYFEDAKCFIFEGTEEELKKEFNSENDYYIIAQEEDKYIVESFTGIMYDFM